MSTTPARGALRAPARPAAAPAIISVRRRAGRIVMQRDTRAPVALPMCTSGPSRPRTRPLPSASKPEAICTGKTRVQLGGSRPRSVAITAGIPLPAVAAAKRRTSQLARAMHSPTKAGAMSQPGSASARAHSANSARRWARCSSVKWNNEAMRPATRPVTATSP